MTLQVIHRESTSSAGSDAVWGLLGTSTTWPAWTPIERCDIVTPGGPDGTGEVRVFRTGRTTVREEVVVRVPGRRLAYVLLGGLALRDYRATIELTPTPDGGTRIAWHTTFRAKVPGTGGLYCRTLDGFTRRFVEGLARHAERPTTDRA